MTSSIRIPSALTVFALSACLVCVSAKASVAAPPSANSLARQYAKAEAYEAGRDYDKALAAYSKVFGAMAEGMPADVKRKCAESHYRSAEIYYRQRLYSLAMSQYLDGLRISEACRFDQLTARIYIGIGNLYSSHSDFEMGIRFYKRALALVDTVGGDAVRNRVLNNLVGASCFSGRTADGERYLAALQASGERSPEHHFNLLMCRGLILNCKRLQGQALRFYRDALRYAEANRLGDGCAEAANSCMAQIFIDTGKPDSAIFYLRRNEAASVRTSNADLLGETLAHLAQAYRTKGDARRALAYKTRYVDLRDSTYRVGEFNAMKNAQFMYEAQKSDSEISSLTQQKQSQARLIAMQRRWIATFVVSLLVVVAFLWVIYRQKMQLRHAYAELYSRSQEYLNGKREADSTHLLTNDQHKALLRDIDRVMADAEVFCASDFSLNALAQLVGANSRYVSEAINEGYGKNFRTFLNEYRIREAMRRLADTQGYDKLTIKAISESVGYKSQANFIAVFTKVTGMKPSIYQKLAKEHGKLSD